MHRSKLTQVLIDVPADKWDGALAFWADALGMQPDPNDGEDDRYKVLLGPHVGLRVLLQRCDWQPSYHLDIEADDVGAEVRRLEALGAVRKKKVSTWWVMTAPTGHDFCVIRPQPALPADACEWENGTPTGD